MGRGVQSNKAGSQISPWQEFACQDLHVLGGEVVNPRSDTPPPSFPPPVPCCECVLTAPLSTVFYGTLHSYTHYPPSHTLSRTPHLGRALLGVLRIEHNLFMSVL
jgi:hypothetical protein